MEPENINEFSGLSALREGVVESTPASRPREIFEALTRDHVAEAYGTQGMNLSRYLELLDPSREHSGSNLDAFQRVLRSVGFCARSMPELGIGSSRFADFDTDKKTGTAFRILVPELIARTWRRTVYGSPMMRDSGVGTTGDSLLGSMMQPTQYQSAPTYPQFQPSIPLSELVAVNTPISGNNYKKYFFEDNAANSRMVRVVEGDPIPRTKLVGQPGQINLYKYGRALETTYEVLRRINFDIIQFQIAKIAVQSENDKVDAVTDVVINGDGNSGTAATVYNLTTLDPAATVGTLTLKAWLAFRKKFKRIYVLTTLLGQDDPITQLELLTNGSANLPMIMLPGNFGYNNIQPINPIGNAVRYGWTDGAPSAKLVGIDKRFAIERAYEIGADISEVDSIIDRQVKLITLTETEGYSVIDKNGSKILNLGA